ncbi:EexN family lipoprotein [Escherichia coli]|uniref:EexN family lipoprotein n=1 Tax=Escherichia coli TaxID=562 RepID=UPI0015D5E142|nr:EexN family lipoprotein [Escherichia coli]
MSYMKKTRILSLVLFSIALSGCGEDIKTVDWWRNHPKEATEKYKECKKSGEDSVNCQNVKKVAGIIGRTYGPMLEILKAESAEYDKQHGLNR